MYICVADIEINTFNTISTMRIGPLIPFISFLPRPQPDPSNTCSCFVPVRYASCTAFKIRLNAWEEAR